MALTTFIYIKGRRRDKIESMVCMKEYMSEIPSLVILDVHEWCNDWGTVSRKSLVKMQWR